MPSTITRPIKISSPGVLPARKIVIPLDDPDDVFVSATAECDIVGVVISDVGPTTETLEYNGETLAIGKALQLTVTVAPDVDDQDAYIYISYVTQAGVELDVKKRISVMDYIPLDTEDQET